MCMRRESTRRSKLWGLLVCGFGEDGNRRDIQPEAPCTLDMQPTSKHTTKCKAKVRRDENRTC